MTQVAHPTLSLNPGRAGWTALVAAGVAAAGLMVAQPASAQNYRDYRDHDRNRSSQGGDVILGAAVGALAGAVIGNGDGNYIVGGALAGAALGAAGSSRDDCGYYRGGRCYRNQGHWEREHGINSRDPRYGYGYDRRDRRYDRRDDRRDRRDYRYDRRW